MPGFLYLGGVGEPMLDDGTSRFPNFLVIGTVRAGTYTINDYLARHPRIFMSPNKEPHFFSVGSSDASVRSVTRGPVHDCVRSMEEYLALFAAIDGEELAGECSVSYLYWSGTAERIRDFNPHMRLLAVLRDPVARAYSSFNYAKGYGLEPLGSLADGFEAEQQRIAEDCPLLLRYRDVGTYSKQLQRYFRVFPRDQVQVVLFEDLVERPVETMQRILEFLGVCFDSTLGRPGHLNATRLPNPSNPLYCYLNRESRVRAAARSLLPLSMRARIRAMARSRYSQLPAPMGAAERAAVLPLFLDDIDLLEEMIGRDLAAWKGCGGG